MDNDNSPILELKNVSKKFKVGNKELCALHDISLTILQGSTLGIVGESGSGKSTLGRILLKLEEATTGEIFFDQSPIHQLTSRQMQPLRQKMQMIFQDPYSSLNPRFTIEQVIGEGMAIHNLEKGKIKKERIAQLLTEVGLDPHMMHRYPHEFSGGQKQRIGIARALAVNPRLLVCDEPLSALDTCTQKQVMDLLLRLKYEKKMTFLFISHDLHAVKKIADRVGVMYMGHLMELAPVKTLFSSTAHPYTEALIHSVPHAYPTNGKPQKLHLLNGEPPSALNPPKGCPFYSRCPKAMELCKQTMPKLQEILPGHFSACHI